MSKYSKAVKVITVGAATAGLFALSACGGADTGNEPGTTSVTIAIPPSIHGLGPTAALEEGLFADEGLDVELVYIQSGSEGGALLAGGDAQFAQLSVDNAIQSAAEGHDTLITVPIAKQDSEPGEDPHGFGSIFVAADGDIESLKDLEGKKIGTSVLGGEAYLNAYQTLEAEGVDASTIEWIQVPGPQHVSSVLQGQTDAAVTAEPNLSIAVKAGSIKPLVSVVGVLPNAPQFGLASQRAWANENPDVVEGVQTAVLEAHRRLNADRGLVEKTLGNFMDLDGEVISMVRVPEYPEEHFTLEGVELVAARLVEFDLLSEDEMPDLNQILYTAK